LQAACIALLLCLLTSTTAQLTANGLNASMIPMAIEEGSPGQYWTKISATLQYPQAAADWDVADARAPIATEINGTIWTGLKQLEFPLVKVTAPAFQGFTFSVDVYTLAPAEYVNLRRDLHTMFSDVARGAVITVSSSRLILLAKYIKRCSQAMAAMLTATVCPVVQACTNTPSPAHGSNAVSCWHRPV
jgi:hypothetical protein